MADEIKQKLGFDVADALDALKRLDDALGKLQNRIQTFGNTLGNFNKTGDAARKVGDAFQSGFGKAASETDKLGQSVRQNLPGAVQQTERLTVSFGLLSRIAFTQAVVRGLSQLRNAIQATAAEAVRFQKSLALISTIDDSGQSLDQLGQSVKNLSDQFNIPLLEASAGLYQTISNQVGSTAESLEFLGEAAKFAKATNSSLESSVDLLSGALKSFGLDASETDRVASTFFKTIDLGRLTADKLSNGFGRVGPRAAELGLSLEEVGASLAAISVKGTNTNESLTFLSNILSGLQKPSEAMAATLAEMGFSSAEVAIKTRGLGGLLDDLSRSTGGSAEQMAKLFPNIRGLSGAVALTSDDLRTFTANLREMEQAGKDFNDQAFLKATQTDAERVTQSLTKLKNEMVTGLGQAALKLADGFLALGGGVDHIIAVAKGDVLTENLFKSLKKKQEADAIFLKSFEDGLAKAADKDRELNKTRLQAALEIQAQLNAAYQKDAENFKTAADQKAAFAKVQQLSPVDENALGILLGKGANAFTTPDQVSQGLIEAEKRAAELQVKVNEALAGEQGIAKLRGDIDTLFAEFEQRDAVRKGFGGGDFLDRNRQNIDALAAELRELSAQSSVSEQDILRVSNAFRAIGKDALQGENPIVGGFAFGTSINALGKIILQLQQIDGIQKRIGDASQAQQDLEAFNDILKQAAPDVAIRNATNALSAGVQPSQSIAAAMERAATAAERMAAAVSRTPTQAQALGGLTHLAAGGEAKGTDMIPALLSPGEFVVKSRSASRFLPQLQAINAGQTPSFPRGDTINQTIGDIAINIQADPSPQKTAEAVMKLMNRATRRGAGKLR